MDYGDNNNGMDYDNKEDSNYKSMDNTIVIN